MTENIMFKLFVTLLLIVFIFPGCTSTWKNGVDYNPTPNRCYVANY